MNGSAGASHRVHDHSAARLAALIVLGCWAVACGDGGRSGGAALTFPKPIPAGLTCANEASAFEGLGAVAYVGGHAGCPLEVDAVTHEVSGSCGAITVGTVRPLMIVYTRGENALSAEATLAYALGSVDLTRENLPDDLRVTVSLGADDIIFEQSVIDAIEIPGNDCRNRDTIEQWAKCFIDDELHTSLVCGGSTTPNLVRACEGTLTCPKS
jgi:hypothetical protein